MLSFAWLRKGSCGEELRVAWQKDAPLPLGEGGSVGPLTAENFTASTEVLRDGGKVVGLITLHQLSNDFSYPGIQFQTERLEMLARKMFSTNQTASSGGVTPPAGGLTLAVPAPSLLPDKFYDSADPVFPRSWPGVLPIVVRDSANLPAKLKLLAADEMVAAFWKMAEFTARGIKILEGRAAREKGNSALYTTIIARIQVYQEAMYAARRLARNVTAEVIFASTDQEALDKSLSYREGLDDMAEFLGLTGWNRIAVIGGRRDVLRKSGLPCSPADVAKALDKVVWANGRQVTEGVAAKCLTIWDRLSTLPEAVEVVMSAQSRFGRGSMYEDWTKLALILQACRANAELIWVMQTLLNERLVGKRSDNYAQSELTKKGSPVQIMILRKRLIDGIIATVIQTGIDMLGTMISARPELKQELDAMKLFRQHYSTVASYYAHGRAEADSPAKEDETTWLPRWVAGVARRVLRACHDGRKDKVLIGLCASPPKGGFVAVRYEDIIANPDLQEEITEIKTAHVAWLGEREGRALVDTESNGKGGPPSVAEAQSQTKAEFVADSEEVRNIRQELAAVAKEARSVHASLIVLPQTALACASAVRWGHPR